MRRVAVNPRAIGALFASLCVGFAHADVLLDETDLVAAPGLAAAANYTFTASTAQALTVTLTDDGQPAAFQSLQIAVTLGDTLIGVASVDGTTGKSSATVSVPAAAGNYQFHVVGTPGDSGYGSFGAFSICTAPQATPTACIAADSFSGTIQAPSTVSTSGQSTLNTTFTVTTAGVYTVTLVDDQFPTALQSAVAGITQGSTPVAGPIVPGTPVQVTLAPDVTYSLLVGATASATTLSGLYSIAITASNGAAVFARTLPVGELPTSTFVSNPAAATLSLSLTDEQYPAPLSSLGVAVSSGADLLGALTASGTKSLQAPAGNLEVWQYAVAGSQPGVYGLTLSAGSTNLLAATEVVNPSDAATATSFAFTASLPSAGTYNLAVADFQFPAQLLSLSSTVAQNGTTIPIDSSGNFTAAAAGTVVVVVDAAPSQVSGSSGIGIFGVTVSTTSATPTILLDQTQAVGGVFTTSTLNLGESGDYDVTLADLGFPADFTDLAVIVTQAGTVLGKVYGGGVFTIPATPGQYVVTFVGTPGSSGYGLYSLNISSAPPTVTLTASASSVPSGQSVQLSWTTTNATSCTASGTDSAWSGNEPTSSSGVAVAITATSTLTLACTGPGGSATKSVNVTATAAESHGGGDVDLSLLALLLGLFAWRWYDERANSRRALPSRSR
jgi:hypothetical protein